MKKINWGTAIVIAFGLFISFILFFVFKVQSNPEYDNELVAEDYYKREKFVQENIEKQKNANKLKDKVQIKKTEQGVTITFPREFTPENIKGTIFLYRPSNKKIDKEIDIVLTESIFVIPKNKLVGGRWDISVDWSYKNENYLNKEVIYY